MTNHYHLLLETIDESISGIMHGILQRFSKWSNWRYEQSGHVFQGRFRNLPVQTDRYFTTVARYIHLNPVHAGMVGLPEEYEWSSYRDLIRGVSPKCIRTDTLLSYFGQNPMIQSDRYQQFVNDGIRQKPEVTDAMLRRKRYWGSPDFFNLPQQKI